MSHHSKRIYRDVNGMLLLDKPLNLSSNAALQIVKRLFVASKAGHTGSLDPLATGMLPICFGEATKFSQFLLNADKRYWVVVQLGIKTATGDAEGEVIEQREIPALSDAVLKEILEKFTGDVEQIPSMFSALKHQGRPLYELARQGLTVERASRTIHVHELKLLGRTENTLTLEVSCSKGTYIRTLVEDIGQAMGCGAYVMALRRLTVGCYAESQMITLEALEQLAQPNDFSGMEAHLLPIDSALTDWIAITISEAAAYYLKRGQPVIIPRAPTSGWVRLIAADNSFMGVGEILDDGRIAPRRLVSQS